MDPVAIKIMRFIILTVGTLRRIEPISSHGYRTGGAAGSALIRSATSWSNIRKPSIDRQCKGKVLVLRSLIRRADGHADTKVNCAHCRTGVISGSVTVD